MPGCHRWQLASASSGPSAATIRCPLRNADASRRLFNYHTANGFGDDFSIAIIAGESACPVKIVRAENFHVPGIRFQFGSNVDFPQARSITDSRKNSRRHGFLNSLWYFISNDLYGHTQICCTRVSVGAKASPLGMSSKPLWSVLYERERVGRHNH